MKSAHCRVESEKLGLKIYSNTPWTFAVWDKLSG